MTSSENEFVSILTPSTGAAEGSASRAGAKSLPQTLPILGLSDLVVFPGMTAPLLVESAQSIRLIDDVVAGDRLVGLVLQRNPEPENPTPEELHEHGCAARVAKMLKFPDGTVRVLVEGLRRFKLVDFPSLEPYLVARIKVLKEVTDSSLEQTALARNAQTQFQEVIKLSPSVSDEVKLAVLNSEQPGKLADIIASNLSLTLDERQRLLATPIVSERLTRLLPLLSKEIEVLTLGSKIQQEVASSMTKSQRDVFLREQIRAIQRELGENDPGVGELNSLAEQIELKGLSPEAKQVALKELERLRQIHFSAAEYTVARNYLDWLIHLPWTQSTEDVLDLQAAERILNQQHYGLTKVKDRLLEFLAVIKLKQKLKGPILCLVGPPGVGKTSLGQSVADSLGRKFARISLGGMRDEAEIRGHRRTYVGAMPGRILQALRRAESNNPVILLDELDKIGADFRGDPAAALLEVLDPQQNRTFTDHYLNLPFDLSRVLFITTANWLEPVHPALRDRLEVIELPSYTASEKLHIAKEHLVPRQLDEHGLKKKIVKLPDATLRQLIEDYTREAGVRQLEREIATLVRKAARKIINQPGIHQPLILTPESLGDYLGPARFYFETAENTAELGIAIGLGWTPVGGDILFIEATRMPGKGTVLLTGSLGEVMKESAQTALSFLRSQAQLLKIDPIEFEKFDIHVHVPAGATPKDGPSAGTAIVTALASVFTRRKVRPDVAMTGEISLRGRVMPVGGIKEKVLAAARAKLRQIVLPERNRNDWLEVPQEVRQKLRVHFVAQISELFRIALQPA